MEELPKGWSISTISDVAETIFGQSPPSSSCNTEGVGLPFFQGKAEFGERHPVARKWCDTPTRVATQGDILISIRAPVGPTNVASENCGIGRGLAAIRSKIDATYVLYWLRFSQRTLEEKGTGTTFSAISKNILNSHKIPVAPLNEQHRIVEKIETLFARLDKGEESLRAVQKLLARYRQSVLKAAVTGELTADWRAENAHRLEHGRDLLDRILKTRRENWSGRGKYTEPVAPNTSDLPELPKGWVWASPDQLSDSAPNSLCIGPFGSNLKVDDYREEGVPLIFVRHIRAKNFSGLSPKFISHEKAQELRSHKVDPGDILITKMGDPPGDVCIYPFSAERAVITADCIKLGPPKVGVSVGYLELALSSDVVQSQIRRISKGVAQQKVNLENFKRVAIPLPPLPLQEMIEHSVAERLSKLATLQEWCDREVNRSSALRQSILKEAFSGRLVDQDTNDEPADELLTRIKAKQTDAKKSKRGRISA